MLVRVIYDNKYKQILKPNIPKKAKIFITVEGVLPFFITGAKVLNKNYIGELNTQRGDDSYVYDTRMLKALNLSGLIAEKAGAAVTSRTSIVVSEGLGLALQSNFKANKLKVSSDHISLALDDVLLALSAALAFSNSCGVSLGSGLFVRLALGTCGFAQIVAGGLCKGWLESTCALQYEGIYSVTAVTLSIKCNKRIKSNVRRPFIIKTLARIRSENSRILNALAALIPLSAKGNLLGFSQVSFGIDDTSRNHVKKRHAAFIIIRSQDKSSTPEQTERLIRIAKEAKVLIVLEPAKVYQRPKFCAISNEGCNTDDIDIKRDGRLANAEFFIFSND